MLRSLRFSALMFCVVLTGCANYRASQTPAMTSARDQDCAKEKKCVVVVTVRDESCLHDCLPKAPDVLTVETIPEQTREIVWAVPDDSGLHFAAQGIEFKLKGAPFDCTQGNGSDNGPHETNTRWTCTDKGGPNKKGWEYTVRLTKDHSRSFSLDPFVVNR